MTRFGLLGPVEVWAGGRPVDVGPPQRRAVLAALVVDAGRQVALDTLVDRVWDATPPPGARAALYAHVARLRRLLDQAGADAGEPPVGLVRRPAGYVLDVDPERVDLHRFRGLVAAAREPRPDTERAGLLRTALGLWRGTPLADLDGDWAARVREAWRQQRLDAVVAWARAELRLGRHDEVIGPVRELVAEQPLAEPLIGVLLRALAAAGRDAEALEHYATARARLVEALGTDPGPELRGLHEALLRGELGRPAPAVRPARPGGTGPALPAPAQLPAPVAGFTGRAAQLAELNRLLTGAAAAPSTMVISAIAGTAGIGKPIPGQRYIFVPCP